MPGWYAGRTESSSSRTTGGHWAAISDPPAWVHQAHIAPSTFHSCGNSFILDRAAAAKGRDAVILGTGPARAQITAAARTYANFRMPNSRPCRPRAAAVETGPANHAQWNEKYRTKARETTSQRTMPINPASGELRVECPPICELLFDVLSILG